jgi:outer membrane lipoprotein carrier protein
VVLKRLMVTTVLAMLAHPVSAGATGDDAGRRLVDDFVSDVQTFRGDFEQVLLDADQQVVERTTGTLEISRPGKFRWSYVEPYEQWLLADGLNIWSYDVDLAQVTVKPQAEALANTPALLLGGSGNALEQFSYEGSYDEAGTTWVRLEPHDKTSGFLRVELGFRDDQLRRMVFFDNLDQTTLVEFRDVAVNEPIDAMRFVFEIPDGVDVVGTPAVAVAQDP